MWHGQPIIYTLGYFAVALVLILLCLPIFTDVLSTDTQTQFDHRIPRETIAASIALKMFAAVPELVPDVKHMSSSLVVTKPVSESYVRTVTGFILCNPVSFDPSTANENGSSFICATNKPSKCGCKALLRMHIVFVLAEENPLAISESGNISQKSGER